MRFLLSGAPAVVASPAVRRLPAGVKMAGAVALLFVTVLLPPAHAEWLALVATVLLTIVLIARIPWRVLGRRMLALSPFVAGVALSASLAPPSGPGWPLIAVRSALSAGTVVVLAATTTFSEMLAVMRRVRVPALLITTLALMHRYLFVLADESERMRRARTSRTLQAKRRLEWGAAASVIGQLFIRTSERAERVYEAMCARGWR